ncbi:MAG: glucokinase [Burkholderiaceae bacterium]
MTAFEGYPRLLGDVGATNARWVWQAAPSPTLPAPRTYRCDDFASIEALIDRCLADEAGAHPRSVAFGIATPVDGDQVAMTNRDWNFSIAGLQARLGAERCLVLNDFAALAAGLPGLRDADLRHLGGGPARAGAPRVVLGPGSGLGVAALVTADGGRETVVEGEGGHATLAPGDAREDALLARLRDTFGHVSAERALSGPGLVNLYRALCSLDGRMPDARTPAEVTARAQAGTDAACVEAMQHFTGLLGSVAGNLALAFGARAGVYLGGGIVPRLGSAFDALMFRARFEAKGRFAGYLQRIPTYLITAPAPALDGIARALDRR